MLLSKSWQHYNLNYYKTMKPQPLPFLDPQEIYIEKIHPIDQIKSPSPKIRQWTPKHRMLSFTLPQENMNDKIHRKYKLCFKYLAPNSDKVKSHTVYFGTGNDFIDHHDQERREKKINQMNNLKNPLHPNYWTGQLLNKYKTIQQGAIQLWEALKKKGRQGKGEQKK